MTYVIDVVDERLVHLSVMPPIWGGPACTGRSLRQVPSGPPFILAPTRLVCAGGQRPVDGSAVIVRVHRTLHRRRAFSAHPCSLGLLLLWGGARACVCGPSTVLSRTLRLPLIYVSASRVGKNRQR